MNYPEKSLAVTAQILTRNMRLVTEWGLRLMIVVNCPGVNHVAGEGAIPCTITSDWTFGGVTFDKDLFHFFMTTPGGVAVKFIATGPQAQAAATWFLDVSRKKPARQETPPETTTSLFYEVPKEIWFIDEVNHFFPDIKKKKR